MVRALNDFTFRLPALAKLALLLLTVWPFVWGVVFLTSSDAAAEQTWFTVGHLLTILVLPLAPLVYALHVIRNPDLGNDRAVWIALVCFLGPVGGVTYWALFLWPSAGIGLGRT